MIILSDLSATARPSTTVTVLITNDDSVPVDVQILGFYVSGNSKIQYVAEEITLSISGPPVAGHRAARSYCEFEYGPGLSYQCCC